MWIKICANTNPEDALLAAESGADAVGFVFAPSKRRVTAPQVAAIVQALPGKLEKIGVFSTHDASEISAIVAESGLTGVQLHGGLNLELARQLREKLGGEITLIQTIHWKVDGASDNAAEVSEQLESISQEPAIDRVLIDSKTAKGSGGTGVSFDWTAARETLKTFPGKLIVAGGLRPDNLAAAIEALQPWGVDVASGVEAAPAKKDRAKVLSFIKAARPSAAKA